MKTYKSFIATAIFFVALVTMASCEDFAVGDKFLQKPPSSDVTIDTIFSNKEYAQRVLWKSYQKLPYGHFTGWNLNTVMWVANIECLTDLSQSYIGYGGAEEHYYNGLYTAGNEDKSGAAGATKYRFRDYGAWKGIRMAWIFYQNVGKVPDMTDAEKARMRAEAKTMVAIRYVELIRAYGAVPIIDHAIDANEEGGFPPRATLEENIEFVIGLLDDAIAEPEFPWALPEEEVTAWKGRLTKASAMAIKARFLLFIASPLFNSDQPYFDGEASDKLMTWLGGYDASRWDDALKACEDFFKELNARGGYQLEKNTDARLGYRKSYFSPDSQETLIASRRYYRSTDNSSFMQSARWGGMCPTKEFFDMFPMADGSEFDWNNAEHAKNPFINRDPRLNENILLDGDIFGSGVASVTKQKADDPTNYPQGTHWGLANALDTKSLESGIAARKWCLDRQGEYKQQPIHWTIMRLAEMYLNYAEALNECGRTDEAYQYINAIRDRVSVGHIKEGLSKEEFREAVLRERAIEFAWEEIRWYDLIRWKREADFKKTLHNLYVYKNKNTQEYEFEFTEMPRRAWQGDTFSAKWYLSAFPLSEVNKGYGLVQNPGW